MFGKNNMKKISSKLIFSLSFVVVAVTMISIGINSILIEKYYLKQKKSELNQVYDNFSKLEKEENGEEIQLLEQQKNVTILLVPFQGDENELNEKLRDSLVKKGISFRKLWLWEDDISKLKEKGSLFQLYNQGDLSYSLLIKFGVKEEQMIVVAKIIPHVTETIDIINQFTFFVFMGGLIIIILLITFLSKKITSPLTELTTLSRDIGRMNFRQSAIHTHDEIEELAESINQMSRNLKQSHDALRQKNQSMEDLLSNVSHEIKTPVALIKVYLSGIRDGLDDGTFYDTIYEQNERINSIVERLILISRVENLEIIKKEVSLSHILSSNIDSHSALIQKEKLIIHAEIGENLTTKGNEEEISSVFINLLTNAIKYTADKKISIQLKKHEDGVFFCISNGINEDLKNAEKLWEPFYVGEKSRSKELSGSGLGLSIVKTILEKHGIEFDCNINNAKIYFTIFFH